jgi:SET domain-containing protein
MLKSSHLQVSLAEGRYQLKALKDIKKGSEICYAYMDVRLPVEMRHMEISRTFMFDCNCQGRTSTGKP